MINMVKLLSQVVIPCAWIQLEECAEAGSEILCTKLVSNSIEYEC